MIQLFLFSLSVFTSYQDEKRIVSLITLVTLLALFEMLGLNDDSQVR